MPPYEALLQPLKVGSLTAKNRIEAAPTLTCIAHADQSVSSELVEFYRVQAKGGAGIITVLETAIDADRAITQPTQLNLGSDFYIPALTSVAEVIKAGGAIASIQLNHGGRQAVSWLNGGRNPIGPSHMVGVFTEDRRRGEQVVEEMTHEMIDEVIDHFAAAAFRAKTAGFDMVMVHAGHGWLISQFVSPAVNSRTDEYGGSLENRSRLLRQVVETVRSAIPEDLPLFVRISATDWVEGGWDIDESVELARTLGRLGVDLIDASSGGLSAAQQIKLGPGYQVPFAERIRREAGIMTAAVGLITEATYADAIVREGKADAVLIARASLRNPYWPLQAARQLDREVTIPFQYRRAWL
jgi:2,4-dienoyl-CoA reductase-like NADH-dependent reductase (Old Yellow Enzyme family)